MMHLRRLLFRWSAVLFFQVVATAVHADSCQNLLDQFKSAADRANRDISSSISNLQDAASQVPDDKKRIGLIAQSCAASAEALGIFKAYRIVAAECMGERETGRSDFLDKLDRSISQIRVTLDRSCR